MQDGHRPGMGWRQSWTGRHRQVPSHGERRLRSIQLLMMHKGAGLLTRWACNASQVEGLLSPEGQLFMVTVAENNPAEILGVLDKSGVTGRCLQHEALLHCIFRNPDTFSRVCARQERLC